VLHHTLVVWCMSTVVYVSSVSYMSMQTYATTTAYAFAWLHICLDSSYT